MKKQTYPVAWRDPFNGDTKRIAADAKRYYRRMYGKKR